MKRALIEYFVIAFVVIAALLYATKALGDEGDIRIAPTVEVSWDMTTNHVYTLWVSDDLGEPFQRHPAYTEYIPSYNREGKLWRGVDQKRGFFRLEVDGVMYPSWPSTNAVTYLVLSQTPTAPTNSPPALPTSLPPDPVP